MRLKTTHIALFVMLAVACNKTTTDTGPESSWTINGVTYHEGSTPTHWDNAGNALVASDNVQNGDIELVLYARPTTSPMTYNVGTNDTCYPCAATCSIDVHTSSDNYINAPITSATVSVTTGSDGKLTATFSGIPMTGSTTLSGTLIEK
jgi:hypothetical protein